MNGGGMGILGLYLSPNDILVMLSAMTVVVILGIAWIIKILGEAIERRPVVIMDNPSPTYWEKIEDMQKRLRWQHEFGDRNDDHYTILYVTAELDYARKQHNIWLMRDRERVVREAVERIRAQQEKVNAVQQ